ncbi:MAG: hypothetical protein NTX82_05545 [Candidatus Parcubacteria bacterium]|nr:hypothetical protein [Candidatus Parcubacteria bacterium]
MDKQLEKNEDKYGYYHGRFQPFHNGHLSMVKAMLAEESGNEFEKEIFRNCEILHESDAEVGKLIKK